jgi:hypothetical protein
MHGATRKISMEMPWTSAFVDIWQSTKARSTFSRWPNAPTWTANSGGRHGCRGAEDFDADLRDPSANHVDDLGGGKRQPVT